MDKIALKRISVTDPELLLAKINEQDPDNPPDVVWRSTSCKSALSRVTITSSETGILKSTAQLFPLI